MLYIFGLLGFVLGFIAGMIVIQMFLRHYSSRALLTDKSLRWTYGLFVWILAGLGAWLGYWVYNTAFPS